MPGQSAPIVIGGGIQGVAPLVVGNFLKLTSVTPAAANTSARLLEESTSIVIAGDGTNQTAIGHSAATAAGQSNQIAIGNGVSTVAASNRAVVIGDSVVLGASQDIVVVGNISTANLAGSSIVMMGQQMTFSGTPSSSVAIGFAVSLGAASSAVVGSSASATGAGAVALGTQASAAANSMSIGQLATSGTGGSANNICIGNNCTGPASVSGVILFGNRNGAAGTVTAGDMILGHQDNANNIFTSTLWLGGPDHKAATAVPAYNIKGKQASGTNLASGELSILPQRATGNAVGGGISIQSSTPVGSGGGQHTLAVAFRVDPQSNITLGAAAGSYGAGLGVVFLGNTGTNPSTNPVGGGVMYANGGALTWRGSAGTVTVIAPA